MRESTPSPSAPRQAIISIMLLTNSLDTIDMRRRGAIGEIVQAIQRLEADFLNGLAGCSYECSAMLLGNLQMERYRLKLPLSQTGDFAGHSFKQVVLDSYQMDSPTWCSKGIKGRESSSHNHLVRTTCVLGTLLGQRLLAAVAKAEGGLDLDKFPPSARVGRR